MYKVSQELGDEILDLDISNGIEKNTEGHQEISKFMKELEEKNNKLETADKNFINVLSKEFEIPKASIKALEEKIKGYVKEFSNIWSEASYIGYDIENDKYYQDYYRFGEYARLDITKKEAENLGIGTFSRITHNAGTTDNVYYVDADYIKDAITLSIKEQLKEGKSIDDVNLFELNDDYKEMSLIAPLYENR